MHGQKYKTTQQKWLDDSQMPFSQPKGTNSRSDTLQDKDPLKSNMRETSNTNANPVLVNFRV